MTPISQKSHDISFAVFRCAALIATPSLRHALEDAAVALVANLNLNTSLELKPSNLELSISPVDKLYQIISLAESVGELKSINAAVLKRELLNLETAIELRVNGNNAEKQAAKELDISSMFALTGNTISAGSPKPVKDSLKLDPSINKPSLELEPSDLDISIDISERQSNILRLIREITFCRLRNILEAMPNVSERTVRNDIQGLIGQQLVRRVGGGGPNSYFESLEVTIPKRQSVPAIRA